MSHRAQSEKWYYKVFQGLGIIYLVTTWVIVFSVNSKSIHQLKQKPIIWSDIFHCKFEVLECCVNLTLELHVVIYNILIGIWHIRYFVFIFCQTRLKLEIPAMKMHILWCRTDIWSLKFSVKVSLMLDNPFPAQFLCKLKHISFYFIQNCKKITCK